jgi:hypothetical protein
MLLLCVDFLGVKRFSHHLPGTFQLETNAVRGPSFAFILISVFTQNVMVRTGDDPKAAGVRHQSTPAWASNGLISEFNFLNKRTNLIYLFLMCHTLSAPAFSTIQVLLDHKRLPAFWTPSLAEERVESFRNASHRTKRHKRERKLCLQAGWKLTGFRQTDEVKEEAGSANDVNNTAHPFQERCSIRTANLRHFSSTSSTNLRPPVASMHYDKLVGKNWRYVGVEIWYHWVATIPKIPVNTFWKHIVCKETRKLSRSGWSSPKPKNSSKMAFVAGTFHDGELQQFKWRVG